MTSFPVSFNKKRKWKKVCVEREQVGKGEKVVLGVRVYWVCWG